MQPPPQTSQPQVSQSSATGLEAIFAQFAGNNSTVPQMQPPQQSNIIDPNLQAALAAFNQPTHPQIGYVSPPPSQSTDLQSMLSQLSQQAAVQPQNYGYQAAYPVDNERKRQLEYDDQTGNDQYSEGKRVRGNKGKKVSL